MTERDTERERERGRERERETDTQRETERQREREGERERQRERERERETAYSFRSLPLMKGCIWMTPVTVHTIIMPMSKTEKKKANKLTTIGLARY